MVVVASKERSLCPIKGLTRTAAETSDPGHTQLYSHDNQAIPATIGACTWLTELYINNNQKVISTNAP